MSLYHQFSIVNSIILNAVEKVLNLNSFCRYQNRLHSKQYKIVNVNIVIKVPLKGIWRDRFLLRQPIFLIGLSWLKAASAKQHFRFRDKKGDRKLCSLLSVTFVELSKNCSQYEPCDTMHYHSARVMSFLWTEKQQITCNQYSLFTVEPFETNLKCITPR